MKNLAVTIIISVSALLLAAGILEKILHRRNIRKIPVRILVNGTRGKTSVTRLIAAILREAGFKTWAKTTGTQAVWILPDGSEQEYRKKNRPVNIREQIPFVRRACKDGAQAIVIECMALHPENQRMMAEEFVRPTIEVITNARVDHISEIGATEEETVSTLALSIHQESLVVTDDERFDAYTGKRINAKNVKVDDGYVESFAYPMFEDNVRQALAVAETLKIDRETALRGMLKSKPDVGMRGPYNVGKCLIINGFACNDIDSARILFETSVARWKRIGEPVWILFNNRGDREFRLGEFVPLVRSLSQDGAQARVIGENRTKVARYFNRHAAANAQALDKTPMDWFRELGEEPCVVFCIGNIRGIGRETIELLEGEDTCCSRQ